MFLAKDKEGGVNLIKHTYFGVKYQVFDLLLYMFYLLASKCILPN